MLRLLPLAAAAVLVAATGLVHGVWTDRWSVSPALAAAADRLGNVPTEVGGWAGEDVPVSRHDLALSGGTSCLARRYTNRTTSESFTVILLCGRPGPVSVHTPDVCYRGLGYEPAGAVEPWASPVETAGRPAAFWTAKLRKQEPGKVSYLRMYWSWSAAGPWEAAESPRVSFAGAQALYKLYVIRQMPSGDEPHPDDSTLDFLRAFLPVLDSALLAP